ncbi:MAG: T9SS type A sorting domain-containing protein, partial [Bacteroidetes bacterium]|nr:T9SS type A sorting domain-containing protein [Bacteroidota bacterium]
PNPGFWWNEEIHLSSDSNFSQYTVLGTSINAGVIRVGNFYNRTLTTQIPNGTFGPHFIRVFIDPTNRLIGDLVRSNNQKFNPIPITLNQLADLIPQSIAIPQQQIFTGQQIQIPYSISNVGLGSTGLTLITDAIYINNLPNLNQATLIGSLSRQRNLNPNTLYFDSISVNIPIWAYGNYYIILQTDATNSVFENIQENNNLLISSSFINPTSNSGVDLSVAEVITPDTMLLGKDYQINYSLTNTGTSNSVGPIRDGFFFGNSPNYIGQNESLFSYRDYNHQISPRDTLSYSLYGRMPGIGTGSYFGHMNTNINLLAPEINLNNNSKSAGAIFIDAQSITLNHPDSFLLDLDEPAYYKIETTDNKDLIIRIQSNHSSSGVNQIFVAYNRIPSTSNFDFISINGYSLNQTALIPNCQIGTYYILVNTQSRFNTKQNIRIQADTLGYQIISCEPNRLGQNVVTTRINGAGFMPGIQFYLTNSNQLNIAQAETIQLISSMQADVTWDLSSVNLGNYILKCVNPNQSIATLNSTPIIVEASSGYAMSGNSVHNDVIRFGRNATFSFTFKNTGNIDIPIARNEIAFPDNVQIMSMNYSGRNSYGLSSLNPVTNSQSEDYFSSGGFHIIPVVCKGMRPGEQLTINVTARDFNQALFPFTQRMQGYSTQNFIKIQLGMAELYRNSIMQNISNFPYSVIQYASNPILYRDTLAKHLISTGLLSPIDTVGLLNPCLFCPSGITIDPGIAVGQVHFNSLNLNSGSVIKWDINLPDRQVGNELGWDVIQVHGQTSISITNEPVKIKIFSKSSFDNSESFLSGFEPWKNQKWPMLISYNGITGFNINHFEIDPTHFNRFNNTFGGSFTLQMSLNFDTLFVVFNPTSPLPGMPGYDGNAGHIGQPGGKGGPGGPGTCLLSPGIGGNGGNGGAGEFGMAPGNGGNGGYGGVSTCTNFPGGTGGRGGNGGNGSVNQNGGNGGNGGIGGPGYYLSSGSRGGVGGNGGSGGAGGSCSNMNLAGTGGSGGSGGRGGQGYGINGNGGNGGNGGNSGNGGNGSGSPGSPGLPGEGGSANNPLLIAGSLGAAGSIGDFGLPVSPNNPCAPDPIGAINVPPVPCNTPQTVNRVLCSQFAESIADNLDCNNSISSAIDNAIRTIGQGIQQSVSTAVGNALFSGIQFGIGLLDCNSSGIEYVSSISCSPNLVDLRNQTTFYPIVSPYCTRYMLCKDIPIITACDPNDIAGPPGYGPERFISRDDTILYTINFENDSNFATTAAQTVRITQFLDSHLSPLSVRIKEFGFGSHTFQVPGQRANFSMTLPLQDQPEIGVDVQVTGGVDVNSYEFFMVFQSVNRYTGLPPSDPRAGFLKVNDSTGRGEGFVTFSVNPISTCVTGDSIFAQADILFDVNSLIMTNQIFNTIDAGKPVSTMGNLNAIQDSTFFELRWSAADDTRGSGVSYLNLFASRNSEPYSLYASILPTDSVFGFTGLPNSRYSLFTQSVDNVNNKENIKNFAENIIFIQSGEIAVLYPQGNSSHCAGDSILISWVSNAEIDSFKIEISSDSGQTFQTIANIVDSIQNSYSWQIPNNLSQGMYLFRVSNPDGRISANSEYVQINRLPAIGLPSTVRVCPGTQTVLHANDGISYSWSPGESLSDSTISEPTVYPDISKWYKVTVTNQNGCSKTDSVFVQVGRFDTTLQTQFACGSSQLYYDTTWLINTIGCDSMVITTYLPRPTFHDTVYFSGICQGDTILAGNFTIISEGWYTDTLKSQFNCDSTIIYRVVYITNNSQQRFISLCNGDSILINNHWIKNSGIYIESFPASNLCDSIIYYSIDVINCSRLHGNLLYDNSIQSPLINTRINLYKNNVLSGTTLTDSLGRYSFERFPVGTYRLEMEDRLDWGGVTATDALLVQRQSTGSLNLSFLRYLAGDVNLNSVVNSADALIISRRWTGLINTFLSGNYAFIAPNIDITYQDSEVNLKTICFGDVNGSYNPNITQLRISPSKIMESDFNPSSNSKTLPIYLNRNLPVGAMSINLFLPEGLQVTDVTLDDESPTLLFKQNGAMLKLSWFNVHGLFSSPDKPLINLHFDNQPEWTNLINKHGIYIDTQGSELADLEGNIYSQWGFSIPNHSPENRIDNVLIYPNPTKSMVYIKGNFDSVAVKDNLGRSLDVTVIYSNPTSIDFSKYSNGVYFISLNKNGKTILRKIVLYRD